MAENMLTSIIIVISFSSFYYTALLHSLLADVSMPQSRGRALWEP